jgi:hypothetical protein
MNFHTKKAPWDSSFNAIFFIFYTIVKFNFVYSCNLSSVSFLYLFLEFFLSSGVLLFCFCFSNLYVFLFVESLTI